jgi:hypothetical protein
VEKLVSCGYQAGGMPSIGFALSISFKREKIADQIDFYLYYVFHLEQVEL